MDKLTKTIETHDVSVAKPEVRTPMLKRYMKPLAVYGFTIFSNAALSFGTFALLTHHLTEVDYGIINLYNSFIILLMPFIGIGVSFVLNVDFFKMDKEEYSRRFVNALIIPVVACLFFTVLLFVFHPFIQRLTKANYFFVAVAGLICLLNVLNDVILNFIRNKGHYFLYAGYSLGKNLLEIGCTILLVIGLKYTWTGRLGSNLITLLAAGLAIAFFIRKWKLFAGSVNWKVVGAILLSGLPFIPERLAIFTLGYSDRFFIDYFSGTADVGYYGAGAQLAMVVNLSILTLNNTFYPYLFKELAQSSIDTKKIRRILLMFVGISALITGAVIISVPFFFKYFIGPAFQPGKVYAIYLAMGLFFWSIYNVFVSFLLSQRLNKLIMGISIFGMLLSVTANFVNVKLFGALGATYTSILVYFSMAVVTIYFVHKHFDLKKIFFNAKVP